MGYNTSILAKYKGAIQNCGNYVQVKMKISEFSSLLLLSLVCNKQSKREIKFHETRRKKKHTQHNKKKTTQTGHFEARKPVQKMLSCGDFYTIFARIFSSLFSCFSVCFFALCLSSITVVFLDSYPN